MKRQLPAPLVVAQRCLDRAWADSTDDRSRRLLEQAHRTIHKLAGRVLRLAAVIERQHGGRESP